MVFDWFSLPINNIEDDVLQNDFIFGVKVGRNARKLYLNCGIIRKELSKQSDKSGKFDKNDCLSKEKYDSKQNKCDTGEIEGSREILIEREMDRETHNDIINGQNEIEDKSKEMRGKKRRRNTKLWKKNIRKLKKARGEEYESSLNKVVEKKEIRETCDKEKCRLKCSFKISDQDRFIIHSEFWSEVHSMDQKRQFICSSVEQVPIKRIRLRTGIREGRRTTTLKYFFTVNGIRIQVCRKYFLNTLTISQTTIRHALAKRQISGIVEVDKRGRHKPHNKINNEIKNTIREHILKFPVIESHCSRNKCKKKYLGKHLNIAKMYALYKEECERKEVIKQNIPKQWLYAEIFNTEFNLSFKLPAIDT